MHRQPSSRVPVVAIVGKGDSGKTTFLEALIGVLSGRGWRVATVKHHVHDFDIDVPGKDSWRHARAGAVMTMVSSPSKFSMIRNVQEEMTLDQIAKFAADVDILIAEGFKRTAPACIEVSRLARSEEPICTDDRLVALVTDNPDLAPANGAPVFDLSDAEAVADFVECEFLGRTEAALPEVDSSDEEGAR